MTKVEKAKQYERAEQFKQLHLSDELLILPNAWDAGSAVLFEKAGFRAIGTTSAGMAYSLGYPDGEAIGFEDVLECSKRMLKRITAPFSVDIETGYSNNPNKVVENVRQVIELGAVGINIEDGMTLSSASLNDLVKQSELIKAISKLKQELDIPFVINARTDVYWLGIGEPETRLNSALERAMAYTEAGADCIFVPGKLERQTMRMLASELPIPLNVIAAPNGLSMADLESLGVARLSLGSGPVRASLGLSQTIAAELKNGAFDSMYQHAVSYQHANELFS